jgi:hypothetical protein
VKKSFSLTLLLILSITINAYSQTDDNFKQYPSIDDPEVNSFIKQGLSYAIELYGEPRIPVNRVMLRYRPEGALTNLTDSRNGIFTIFLSRKINEYSFYGQLAHEIAHLLNAQLFDAYIEGLNTVFSEKLLKRSGRDWSGWEDYYREYDNPFYSATYFMMKEVTEIAGESAIRSFLSYAKYRSDNSQRMYIDIEEWISSLPAGKRGQVTNVILRHAEHVHKSANGTREKYIFMLPK